MSEYNCNALNRITISDSFRQRLLSVPETALIKPHHTPIRYYAAAASMVLVFGLSISAYFFSGNKPAPVVPAFSVKESEKATESTELSETSSSTQESDIPSTETNTQPPTQPPTQVSTDSEGNIIITTITDIITEYGTKPADPDSPAKPADSEEKPDQPVDYPTEQATAPPEPQNDPPYYPTPTDKPYEPEPAAPGDSTCYAFLPLSALTGSGNVYCAIFDRYGNLLGDENVFSSSHLAVREWERDGYVWLSYSPYNNGLTVGSELYDIYFFNEDGEILSHESTYLS
ncbi:MAG: hypothetical protein IJH32_09600 [Ruminococcus sp.]|nr:hypothetical protein [Ruminococcus sp.]